MTARRSTALTVATAGHCANTAYSVVRFFNGHVLYGSAARVARVSDTVDLATVNVTVDATQSAATPPVIFAHAAPSLGSAVTIIGHPVSALSGPAQGRWTVTSARMGDVEPNQETGALEYEVYCPRCGPGDSGSGVFDGEGRLVGMVYGVTEIQNAAGGRLPDGLYADVIPAAALR